LISSCGSNGIGSSMQLVACISNADWPHEHRVWWLRMKPLMPARSDLRADCSCLLWACARARTSPARHEWSLACAIALLKSHRAWWQPVACSEHSGGPEDPPSAGTAWLHAQEWSACTAYTARLSRPARTPHVPAHRSRACDTAQPRYPQARRTRSREPSRNRLPMCGQRSAPRYSVVQSVPRERHGCMLVNVSGPAAWHGRVLFLAFSRAAPAPCASSL
jgi:hypothetical protein